MKQKILKTQKQNPDWGYKKIANHLGCDPSTVRYHTNPNYRNRHLEKRFDRRKNLKKTLVEENGGKCCKCGYNKCLRALEFHHLDPSTKDFDFGQYRDCSLERARKEIQKCILVCSNCHMEIHDEIENANTASADSTFVKLKWSGQH